LLTVVVETVRRHHDLHRTQPVEAALVVITHRMTPVIDPGIEIASSPHSPQ
jgi:hypothetical protein